MSPSMKDQLELPCGLVLPNRLVKVKHLEGEAAPYLRQQLIVYF